MTPQVTYNCQKLSPSDNQAAANCKKLYSSDLQDVLLLSASSPKVSITVTNCHSLTNQLASICHALSSMITNWTPTGLELSHVLFHWPPRWPLIVTNCQTRTPQVTYNCQKLLPSDNQAVTNCKNCISVTSQVSFYCQQPTQRCQKFSQIVIQSPTNWPRIVTHCHECSPNWLLIVTIITRWPSSGL